MFSASLQKDDFDQSHEALFSRRASNEGAANVDASSPIKIVLLEKTQPGAVADAEPSRVKRLIQMIDRAFEMDSERVFEVGKRMLSYQHYTDYFTGEDISTILEYLETWNDEPISEPEMAKELSENFVKMPTVLERLKAYESSQIGWPVESIAYVAGSSLVKESVEMNVPRFMRKLLPGG